MISMRDKTEIILQYFREGKSEREISRVLGLHRKTIKRYIEEHKNELLEDYSDINLPLISVPEYDSAGRCKRVLTDDICVRIDSLLALNREREKQGFHKQKLKKCDIHDLLQAEGFQIGYTSVCNYIRVKESTEKEAYIRQQYTRGDVCEFDWGEVKLLVGGKLKRLQLAIFTPAYSNYRFARLFARQDTQSFQQAHVLFFRHCGGVFREMVYDNMRVAISKFTGVSGRELTDSFLSLSGFYKFGYRFCNIRRGNEKGHVERSVEYVRRKAFALDVSFETIAEANIHLQLVLDDLNKQTSRTQQQSIRELFGEEQSELYALSGDFDCSNLATFSVDKYSCIQHDTNHYSMPDAHVGKRVTARIYSDKIRFYYHGNYLCTHTRHQGKNHRELNLDHYLKTLIRKPGALHSSVALAQANTKIRQLYENHFQDSPKDFLRLVVYIKESTISLSDVFLAVNQIKKISPQDVSVDKIIVVCESILHPNTPVQSGGDICEYSHKQLEFISLLLNLKNQNDHVRKSY